MQNAYFPSVQTLFEKLQKADFNESLQRIDVIAIGLEAFFRLIQLKESYPNLKVGFINNDNLSECFEDGQGFPLSDFEFIPINNQLAFYERQINIELNEFIINQLLDSLPEDVLFFGSLLDYNLLSLLKSKTFKIKNLILRRPCFFEKPSLNKDINNLLSQSKKYPNITVIDSNKILRILRRIHHDTPINFLYKEIESQWMENLQLKLKLNTFGNELWDSVSFPINLAYFNYK